MRFFVCILFLLSYSYASGNNDFSSRLDKIQQDISLSDKQSTAEAELKEIITEISNLPESIDKTKLYLKAQLLFAQLKNYQLKYDESITILVEIVNLSVKNKLPEYTYEAYLEIAMIKEFYHDYGDARKYLDQAKALAVSNGLDSVMSTYFVRAASFYRFIKKKDSAVIMANKGVEYALKYGNAKDENDCYLLLGMTLPDSLFTDAINYYKKSANYFNNRKEYPGAISQYLNISGKFLDHNIIDSAEHYNSMAEKKYLQEYGSDLETVILKYKYQIFEAKNQPDSAFFYFKKYHESVLKAYENDKSQKIKAVTSFYENQHKESIIKNQNYWIILISAIALLIIGFSVILFRKNKKINSQNKIISQQVDSLTKLLSQKESILHEMHHRVKNNLQNVISILEMQKESINFNNIEELIRGNQNRIHSMALLHKKLDMSEIDGEIKLAAYLKELSELVMGSYQDAAKSIIFQYNCTVEKLSLSKALPLGLIIVELVSNSMKYAFEGKKSGVISIEILPGSKPNTINLVYLDNGVGFDFDAVSGKGLGMEIIKGLIDQLDATYKSLNRNGFNLSIVFKENKA